MYSEFKTKRNILVVLLLVFFISLGVSIGNVTNSKAASNRKVVNVVFVLDNTGSMSDEIANVKNNIGVFADYISNYDGIDELRMALITYQDIESYYNGSYEDSVVYLSSSGSPWFTDAEELKSTIDSIELGYGGDGPETLYDGLGYLVDDLLGAESATIPFSSDAYKFAFVLTDADVKTSNYHGITGMDHMVSLLNEKNIYTSVVCPTSYKTYYQSLYEETGGTWININSSNFSDAMVEYAESILSIVQPDVVDLSFSVNDIYSFEPLAKEYGVDTDAAEYTSSNTELFTFDSSFKYVGTAIAQGTVYVTITDGVNTLKCYITITESEADVPVEELAISIEVYVGVDQSVYVKAVALPESATEGGLTWSVGDSSIISIEQIDNNTCLLKGISSGTTTVTVISKDGGYSASTEVTVTVDPIVNVESVEISGCESETTMTIGNECSVVGAVLPLDATNDGGYWYSSDSSIVEIISVSGNTCTYKAVGCGNASVYFVSNEGGYTASISVTIEHTYSDTPYSVADYKAIYLCNVCGNAIEVILPHTHNYTAEEIAPTCTEGGYITYTCSICGESYVVEIEATGHSWNSGEIITAATCTTDGAITYTCTVCGETKTEVIEAAHNYESVVTVPTCTEKGYTTYTCTVCGDSYVADETEATGHKYIVTSWTWDGTEGAIAVLTCENDESHTITETAVITSEITTAATETADGVMTYIATVTFENETYTDTKTAVIPATGTSGSNEDGSGSDEGTNDKTGNTNGSGCATFFVGGGSSFGGDIGLVIASFALIAFVVVVHRKRTV